MGNRKLFASMPGVETAYASERKIKEPKVTRRISTTNYAVTPKQNYIPKVNKSFVLTHWQPDRILSLRSYDSSSGCPRRPVMAYESVHSSQYSATKSHKIIFTLSLSIASYAKSILPTRITSQMSCCRDHQNWASDILNLHNQCKIYYIPVYHFLGALPYPDCFHLELHSNCPSVH